MRRPSGLSLILVATAVASVASYLVIWLVPVRIGFADYKPFGLFWAAMYFVVGALSGIQQEITRATVARDLDSQPRVSAARNFAVAVAIATAVVIIVSAPLWAERVFEGDGSLVLPLALAASGYVLVAVLAGTLYGIKLWVPVSLMIAVDAVLRLVSVLAVAAITSDPIALAWAAAIPFPLTIAILWLTFCRRVVGRTAFDVGYRALSWNVVRTLAASTSTGVLVSGLPVIIDLASVGESAAFVAALFTAVTIIRAPVIVAVTSLQSYLVVFFRDQTGSFWRRFVLIQGAIASGSVLLGLLAWLVAPPIIGLLYGGRIDLDGWVYAVLVVSSGLVGTLAVSGTAVLSMSEHFAYSVGWLAAAVVTVACFALPLDLLGKTVVAVLVGPVAGLAVHAVLLAKRRRSPNLRHV